jgi:dipeptidyl aminopeptidase/acylaminoacyl peptidase
MALRLFLAIGFCIWVRTEAGQLLPVDYFFKPFEYREMLLSPNGKHLGALVPWGEQSALIVIDLDTRKLNIVGRQRRWDVIDFMWKGNDWLIFKMGFKGYDGGGLYVVDRQGSKAPRVLIKPVGYQIEESRFDNPRFEKARLVEVLDLLHDHPDEILIESVELRGNDLDQLNESGFPNVYRLNVRTGKLTLEEKNPGNVLAWLTDRTGVVRLGLIVESSEWAFRYRTTADGAWKVTARFKLLAPSISPVAFDEDNQTLIVFSEVGRDTTALCTYDIAKNEIKELLCAHERYDIDESIILSREKKLIGVRFNTDRPATQWFTPELARAQKALDLTLTNRVNEIRSLSATGDLALVHSFSDRTPGVFYLYDLARRKIEKISEIAEWIKPEDMAQMVPIQYQARDGLGIHGYITLPVKGPTNQLPMVVYPHGGPWSRDIWGFDREVQFLANRGYAVLQVNFRGSTGYGMRFREAGYKQWGLKMQDDITDGVKWAIEKGIADPGRIAIYGASYGGYAAVAGLAFTPELYRCGVSYVGVTDLSMLIKEVPRKRQYQRSGYEQMVGDPKTESKLLSDLSPVNQAQNIRVPVLLAYGKWDSRVSAEHGRQLEQALKRHGRKVEFMLEDEGHGFSQPETVLRFHRRLEKFLGENMLPLRAMDGK